MMYAHGVMLLAQTTAPYWPFWLAGLAVGLFVVAFRLATGRMLGVSGGFSDLCAACTGASAGRSPRLPFLLGIVGGGVLAGQVTGQAPTSDIGPIADVLPMAPPIATAWFIFGGLLIGFGTAPGRRLHLGPRDLRAGPTAQAFVARDMHVHGHGHGRDLAPLRGPGRLR